MIGLSDFWPLYLRAHRRRSTRGVHYAATVLGMVMAAWAAIVLEPWAFFAGIGGGYVMAIGSHWLLERNHPLILVNPVWGAISDLRMFGLAMTGRLRGELARYDALSAGRDANPERGTAWRVSS
jgi:hypothetical protein